MDSKQFWLGSDDKRSKLLAGNTRRVEQYRATSAIAELCGQPESGSIFMVSLDVPGVMEAGSVVEMNYRLAGQRVMEQTHDVASAEQILQHKEQQRESAATITAMDRRRAAQLSGHITLAVEPLQPRTGK